MQDVHANPHVALLHSETLQGSGVSFRTRDVKRSLVNNPPPTGR